MTVFDSLLNLLHIFLPVLFAILFEDFRLLHLLGVRPDLNIVALLLLLLFEGFTFLLQNCLVERHDGIVFDFFALLKFDDLVLANFGHTSLQQLVEHLSSTDLPGLSHLVQNGLDFALVLKSDLVDGRCSDLLSVLLLFLGLFGG